MLKCVCGARAEWFWRENHSTWRKPCSITTLSTTNPTWTGLGNKFGLTYWETGAYLPKPWYSPLNCVIHTLAGEFTYLNPPGKQHLGHACISDFSAVLLPCKVFLELWLPSYQTTCYHLQEDSTLNENVRSHKMQEVPLRGAHRPQRTLLVKVCVMLVVYVAGVLKFCVSSFLSQFEKKHTNIGLLRAWCLCVDKSCGSGGAHWDNSMLQSTFKCVKCHAQHSTKAEDWVSLAWQFQIRQYLQYSKWHANYCRYTGDLNVIVWFFLGVRLHCRGFLTIALCQNGENRHLLTFRGICTLLIGTEVIEFVVTFSWQWWRHIIEETVVQSVQGSCSSDCLRSFSTFHWEQQVPFEGLWIHMPSTLIMSLCLCVTPVTSPCFAGMYHINCQLCDKI